MNVAELMTTTVVTVKENTKVHEIATLMREFGVSTTPVTDDTGGVVGVVCSSDLLLKLSTPSGSDGNHPNGGRASRNNHRKATAITAAGLMTSPAVTVRDRATVAEAAHLMRRHQVRPLPVTGDDGRLVGLVSRDDLLRADPHTDAEISDAVGRALAGDTRGTVRVTVHDGIVVLTGRVRLRSTIFDLLRATRHVEGVVRVENRLDHEYDNVGPGDHAWRTDPVPMTRPRDGQRPRPSDHAPEGNAATPRPSLP